MSMFCITRVIWINVLNCDNVTRNVMCFCQRCAYTSFIVILLRLHVLYCSSVTSIF